MRYFLKYGAKNICFSTVSFVFASEGFSTRPIFRVRTL